MEELLKQVITELQGFRKEVNERFDGVDEKFAQVDDRFTQVDKRFDVMDVKFTQVDKRFDVMDVRFEQIDERFDSVDKHFDGVDQRFDGVDQRLDQLEQGQIEIKDTIRHSATLMTENFTAIRQEIREKIVDTQADVNLLFKEVEGLKRQTFKLEQRISN